MKKTFEIKTINGKNIWVHILYPDGYLISTYNSIQNKKGNIITNEINRKEKKLTIEKALKFEEKNKLFLTDISN
jgi:hypothetical protein